mgnify:FL=1
MAKRRRYNHKRRRGSFSFLYKLLAFVLICTAIALALTLFFRIRTIQVSGNDRYTREEIIAAAEVKEGDNLFLMNKYNAAERIRKALPYIETVQFRRMLPDGLSIVVTECADPAAVVQDGKAYLLCDTGNIVDEMAASAARGRMQVNGLTLTGPAVGTQAQAAEGQELTLERLLELMKALDSRGMTGNVSQLDMSDASQLTLRYLDRFDVYFPWDADYGYKLDYLLAVVEKLEVNEKGIINMMQEGKARFIPE